MEDFSMTLGTKESAQILAWLGKNPKKLIGCHLWAEDGSIFSIAIEIEGQEKFVVKVSDRGNKIEVTKNISNQ